MIALQLRFGAGELHEAPWEHAQAGVEWPPSPYRLLQTITAGWHAAGSPDPEDFIALMSAMTPAPRYLLPPPTARHPRHIRQGSGWEVAAALVLDDYDGAPERAAEAYVIWDRLFLDPAQYELLRRCAAGVTSLGSPSHCELQVAEGVHDDTDLIPVDLAHRVAGYGPIVRRLGFESNGFVQALRAGRFHADVPLTRDERLPVGLRWMDYRFPAAFGRDPILEIQDAHRKQFFNRCERFALMAPRHRASSRPSVTDTLTIGEAFRGAVMSRNGRAHSGRVDPAFSGKAPDGRPALGHEHAFFLPKDLDHDGFIDHVDVWVPGRLGHAGYRALVSVRRLYDRGLGLADDEHYTVAHLGEAPRVVARRWRSATPFVLPRHQKLRGPSDAPRLLDDPEAQMRTALVHHGFAAGELLAWERGREARVVHTGGRATLAALYRTARRNERAYAEALTVTIEFAVPTAGPIVLGKHAHFGMGQFEPVSEVSSVGG